ncbi:hypothetical protein BGZ63DRAFT_270168 [Mariannaea sp. PMI_226]|nr:hypothetical protein BGZ63DRAFT_270168 [Mariannaea sp. PMI_226]
MPDYPGLGLNLRFLDQKDGQSGGQNLFPMGIHCNCYGSDSEMLLVREVAMMIVMDRLTDKPDWHLKVFDDAIAEKWTEEALAIPVDQLYDQIVMDKLDWEEDSSYNSPRGLKKLKSILDKECLDYCIKELRAKAEFFKASGLIPTLDSSASVVKSDSFVDASLHEALQKAFVKLKEEQRTNPDWHPRTNEQVQDLVHPSMYPLVYGRSRVFKDEVVGVDDAIDKWAGKGEIIPMQGPEVEEPPSGYRRFGGNVTIGSSDVDPAFWSNKYQWLPSNVKFQDDGSVKFTSYINNLHPSKHQDTYRTIEKLIERALPAWDQCIAEYVNYNLKGAGRTEPRFPRPDEPECSDDVEENWAPRLEDVEVPQKSKSDDAEEAEVSGSDSEDEPEEDEEVEERDADGTYYWGTRKEIAWKKIREPVPPAAPEFRAWPYGVQPGRAIRDRFKDIQVIVKMASIELTPEKPEFPAGGWHVEGQMNEHIVGTALYYLDSENVTPSHLAFRMQTSSYQDDWNVGQQAYTWMERVYGTWLGGGGPCLQNYGSVETKEGRLLAFPNVFHHRVSPFELKDKTKPGHRRFIALWLVDPYTRIISTANVPPQQQSWWLERAFGGLDESNADKVPQAIAELVLSKAPDHPGLEAAYQTGKKLPAELQAMVRNEFGGDATPMSLEEAREHRLKLMDVRSTFQDGARGSWQQVQYSFCEH